MKRDQQKSLVLAIVSTLREHARSGIPEGPGHAGMQWEELWRRLRANHTGIALTFQQEPINVTETPTFHEHLAKWGLAHAEMIWRFLPTGWKLSRFDRDFIEVTFP